ncbi:glyceraldehyde dehydrogenase subunit alpha [Aeropyrum pernix]|uniref:glyceraldehyde dehydrogenase subunit alpha n=1 Tax=Aeropyrum pernix TaxID=56636 RepID=UPI001A94992E|nr:glyceraldehyde dehydrogenase subunit alpha [Aeropyrum pernix]
MHPSRWIGWRYVGRRVKRVEDHRLLTGRGRYVDDVRLEGMLYAAFARSEYPHALVRKVDLSDALKAPGVVAAFSYSDLEGSLKPWTFDAPSSPMYPLARDKVRYYGEPVAVVVARDPYQAADAVELVSVDYEPLEPVVDPLKAMEPDAPRVHDEAERNIAYSRRLSCGDVEKAFREAAVVVEDTLWVARKYAASLEPRGVAASYDGSTLTVWVSTQTPHDHRDELLEKIVPPPSDVRVIQPDVGGAFGAKIEVYPEEVVVPYLAMRLGRPVKWYPSRREDMVATTHGRDIRAELALAASRDGRILGVRGRIIGDVGAYPLGIFLPLIAGRILPGPYDVRSGDVEVLAVYTNKTPLAAYRGAGRPEGIFFMERMVDLLADELGMDPAELRLRNMVKPEAMPYRNCFGWQYDSGDYPGTLKRGLKLLRLRELESWVEEERRKGRLLGLGYAFYVEITSGGPFETAKVSLERGGTVSIVVGSTPTGQGDATGFAQIAADILGVGVERVRVRWGDTGLIGEGVGTFGSRTITVGGGAVIEAVSELVERLRPKAAEMLGVDPGRVEYRPGEFYVVDSPEDFVGLWDVVEQLYRELGEKAGEVLSAYAKYDPKKPVYPYGLHAAVVEIDPETGVPRVVEYRALDDVGRIVNPMLLEGQLVGGIVQGIGDTLYEEMVYTGDGYPATLSLSDYGVPTALEYPEVVELHFQETPTHHPHGTRGVGEIGTIAAPPAVARAVEDAVRRYTGRGGFRVRRLPVKPEDILAALAPKG